MTLKLPLVFACSLVAGAAGSALADPPRPDPGVPPLSPPTDPTAPVTDAPAPMTPAPITTTTTTINTTTPPVSSDLDTPPGTPVPGITAYDAPVLVVHDRPDSTSYAWHDPYLASGIGIGVTVGGGLTGFTDRAMRDTVSSNVGGLWEARVSLGTHVPIGLDVSYVGSAANINTIDGNANGTLVGTTTEAALRYNILPHNTLNPYIFGGAGWQRYDVTNMHFAQSDTGMAQHDGFVEFPMGAGFGIRDLSGFTFDMRGTFRATTDSRLLQESSGNYAQLHSWDASGSLGYEF